MAEVAFLQLKEVLITALVLFLPDLSKPFTVELDASQYEIGAVLMQDQDPVVFISKTLSPKNQLLSLYDKELLALVHPYMLWRNGTPIYPYNLS